MSMKRNLRKWMLLIIVAASMEVQAQQNEKDLPSIIPPSPEMSSLGKFVEQPVSKYTGVPQISIPVYNIRESGIEIPISLNYHSSGIKVEEVSGWVGLGWSLSAGGSVMRSVRGLPDDLYSKKANLTTTEYECNTYDNVGYLYCGADIERMYNANSIHPLDSLWQLDQIRKVGMGAKDAVPDIFYFSFGKYFGEFVFDKNGNINIIPRQDLRIVVQRQNGREIIGFAITTPEGLQYNFNDIERSTITSRGYTSKVTEDYGFGSIQYALENDGPFFGVTHQWYNNSEFMDACSGGVNRISYNSSWQLTSIVSLKDGARVDLKYRNENVHTQSYSGETLFWWDETRDETAFKTKSAASSFVQTKVIDTIKWNSGKVVFVKDAAARLDMDTRFNSNHALDKIIIHNLDGVVIASYKLNHDYFTSLASPGFVDAIGTDYTTLNRAFQKRLKLTEIRQEGSKPYIFEYNTSTSLPHRASLEQDFWGYYNGNASVSTMFPVTYEYPGEVVNDSSFYTSTMSFYPRSSYSGIQKVHTKLTADRSANENNAQAWILKRIIYPTGGATQFNYGLNEFYVNGQKLRGAGLRVAKQITAPDGNFFATKNTTKDYDYHESGQIVSLPQFAAIEPKLMYHSSWSAGLALTKGSFIAYGKVSEVTPLGKITEVFSTPAMFGTWKYGVYQRPVIQRLYLSQYYTATGNCASVFAPGSVQPEYYPRPDAPNYDWARGVPLETIIYDANGSMKDWSKNFYTLKSYVKIPNVQVSVIYTEMVATVLGDNQCFSGKHCYNYTRTYSISPWMVLDSTVHYQIENGDSLITASKYLFESPYHLQTTGLITTKSDDNNLLVRYKYAPDYPISMGSMSPEVSAIQAMQNQNIIFPPLESTTFIKKSGTEYLKRASVNTFRIFGTNAQILPYKTFSVETDKVFSGFQPSAVNSGVFIMDTNYKEQVFLEQYDSRGNILSYLSKNGLRKSYIWGYGSILPIAEVIGATSNDIAYTSFEDIDHGKFAYSGSVLSNMSPVVTGNSSYYLSSGPISCNLNSSLSYTISLWATGSVRVNNANPVKMGRILNGWTYYEYAVSTASQLTVSGNGNIDELRVYPSSALMTTYTYKPLVGITSRCDPNNRISYYDYDNLGRLGLIRDQDQNVLKKFCYNYFGQPIDCTSPCVSLAANWQNTNTPPRCQQSSPCVYTGYQEQEQKDMNPCSPTYNQLQWATAGYNPTACAPGTNVTLTYQNLNRPGFTAVYTNSVTGQVFTFPIPQTGSGPLGCLPPATYFVTVSKPGNSTILLFNLGCRSITGTSASTKITVSTTACNVVNISLPEE